MRRLDDLIKQLEGFSEGDLVTALVAKEAAQTLELEEREHEGPSASLFHEIAEVMNRILLGQEDKGETLIASYLSRVRELEEAPPVGEAEEAVSGENGIVIDDPDILFSFLQEAREHLDTIEEDILTLEREWSEDLVHAIFRSMHTIKGVSGFIGLKKIKQLSHRLENLLDELRVGTITVDSDCIDILLQGSDRLNGLIGSLELQAAGFHSDKGGTVYESGADIDDIIDKLDAILKTNGHSDTAASRASAPSPEKERKIVEHKAPAYDPYADGLITPEMVQKFVEESSDLLDTAENAALSLERGKETKANIEEAFRVVHTIKGNAGFFWFGTVEGMCMAIEGVLDALRKGDRKVDSKVVNLLLEGIDNLRTSLKQIQSGDLKPGVDTEHHIIAEKAMNSKNAGDYQPLGDLLVEMGVASRESVDEALELQQMRLGEILVKQGKAEPKAVEKALESQGKPAGKNDQFANYRLKRKDIRVDTERLDTLFDLMGELITAEAMVLNSPELEEFDHPNFDRSAAYLSKISRELQEITMTIRMIPMDGLFNKMRRLVRDLSKKFNKEISLVVSGEETEMDRNVMEEISDPLVHIIRNAIDHGIEDPESRKKAGKAEDGTIELRARYEGNEIWVTIADDGGGLNKKRILERAMERGLVQDDQVLSDKEVFQLIFEPGFSTAEQVSEISGRGVGMDVVKKNLEKLRGKIDIESQEEKGTTFTLKIPLTLAIIDAINFTVGRQLYAIPITDVIQFYKAVGSELTETEEHRQIITLRGQVLPLIKMKEFFAVTEGKEKAEEGIVIVVRSGNHTAALLADEIVGYRQMVIKALPSYLGNLRAVSGCSIMSDGKVSLIVDTGALLGTTLQ
jgi:two-component system chemotaxis sensor kinase CheA